MQGLMMQHELMISDLIEHAATVHSKLYMGGMCCTDA